MNKTYIAKKHSQSNLSMDSSAWDMADIAFINCFRWDVTGYQPHSEVRVLYSEEGMTVKFTTNETPVTARYGHINDPVYLDSCVEIFLNPFPSQRQDYFNFEINAAGALLLGIGPDRNSRQLIREIDFTQFDIQTRIHEAGWDAKLYIPFSFIKQYAETEETMLGNFQKCAEESLNPHFGTWAPVETKTPDFHRPEYFGKIILE